MKTARKVKEYFGVKNWLVNYFFKIIFLIDNDLLKT